LVAQSPVGESRCCSATGIAFARPAFLFAGDIILFAGDIMKSPLLVATLLRADHSRSFQIHVGSSAGWDVTEERDQRVIRRHYGDWHRVERARAIFARAISELREEGWLDA